MLRFFMVENIEGSGAKDDRCVAGRTERDQGPSIQVREG